MKKHWGWGLADSALTEQEIRDTVPLVIEQLGFGGSEVQMPVPLESAQLPAPRLKPGDLADITVADRRNRAVHALGKAYRDVVRGFRGDFANAPDFVAYPRSERDVERVLEWADTQHAAVIPYGGGTSVVGGVEPRGLEAYNGIVSLDVSHMDRVLEVDVASRAASVQAGAAGPVVEEQLKQRGLTTRFFPQSFEFSTVGGWIATRAGGHYASGPTHIDDMVESIRAITPRGLWESRRLPASGAGPSPDRLLLGSEGALAVITQAWLRVVPRPEYKQGASMRLPDFAAGCEALREVLHAGLSPANCRLIDGEEAPGDDPRPLLVLGFEGSLDVAAELSAAQRICRKHAAEDIAESAADSWRGAFLQAPYLRDILVSVGVMAETFETATTWDRLDGLLSDVRDAAQSAVIEVCGRPGRVTCRLTHVYTDGAAPYFTVLAPVARGEEIDAWDAIKVRVSDALLAAGGTITHHHGVGRDHMPWYDQQRPEPFAAALRAAKNAVDPAGLLNPGVLVGLNHRRAAD